MAVLCKQSLLRLPPCVGPVLCRSIASSSKACGKAGGDHDLARGQSEHENIDSSNAEGDGEDEEAFEKRLAALKSKRGTPSRSSSGSGSGSGDEALTPYQQLKQNQAEEKDRKKVGGSAPREYGPEMVRFEGPPHRGDLASNILLGATLLWLPLTAAAVGRAAFVKYRFTDKRVSVITSAPWKNEQLDAAYSEVKSVISVGRGIGLWGDMVITLRNGDKIELRSLPDHKELEKYILERKAELASETLQPSGGKGGQGSKGFGA